jgi:hypothetical protein
MIEVLKQAAEDVSKAYDVLAFAHTERALELLAKTRTSLRQAIAGLESQEPVAHCEAGPEFCQQCYKESLPTYGSEEVSKLREVIQSQAKIIADYEKQIDEPAIYPEEAYEMGLEAIAYYTHPPQRTWVGLTNDELTDLFYNTNLGQQSAVSQAVALLKERNS